MATHSEIGRLRSRVLGPLRLLLHQGSKKSAKELPCLFGGLTVEWKSHAVSTNDSIFWNRFHEGVFFEKFVIVDSAEFQEENWFIAAPLDDELVKTRIDKKGGKERENDQMR